MWGIYPGGNIYTRRGITKNKPGGTGWKQIPGKLKQISTGNSGVWGVDFLNRLYYRVGTYCKNSAEGSDWKMVSKRFVTSNAFSITTVISERERKKI